MDDKRLDRLEKAAQVNTLPVWAVIRDGVKYLRYPSGELVKVDVIPPNIKTYIDISPDDWDTDHE